MWLPLLTFSCFRPMFCPILLPLWRAWCAAHGHHVRTPGSAASAPSWAWVAALVPVALFHPVWAEVGARGPWPLLLWLTCGPMAMYSVIAGGVDSLGILCAESVWEHVDYLTTVLPEKVAPHTLGT